MANFRLGTNELYYSGEQPERESRSKLLGVAGLGLLSGAAIGSGFMPYGNGNLFDRYYKTTRVLGHASPFGLFASVRAPEAISPFLSKNFQSFNRGFIDFSSEELSNPDTLRYFSNITNKSISDLRSLGISSGASARFTRHSGFKGLFGSGKLEVLNNGSSSLLSNNIMLLERNITTSETFTSKKSVNQFAEAVISVIDENAKPRNLLNVSVNGVMAGGYNKYIPIPSILGDVKNANDIVQRVTYFRGIAAFEAQRLNRAIQTITENVPVVGELAQPFLNTNKLLVKNGPALKMSMRYTALAGKIGLVAGGIAQYDYMMRYHSDNPILKEIGYGVSSAAAGYGILSAAVKYGNPYLKGKAAPIGAIAATAMFFSQNILSNFDKGIVAGISSTISDANIFRSYLGEYSGISWARRQLEDTMPGVTDSTTGIFTGLMAYGAYSLRHYKENRYYQYYKHAEHLTGKTGFSAITDTFKDLDVSYNIWEKISLNLKPTHDLDFVRAAIASGTWKRSVIPGEKLNTLFEEKMKNLIVNRTPIFTKDGLAMRVGKHLASSSHAKYKGFTGATLAFLSGFTLHSVLTSGLIGTIETPEQLERYATGEELVPIRKSRWWGAGGTPYEGGKIAYYRPSLRATIVSDAENYAKWGPEVEEYSPLTRWFKENFSYDLEEKNYDHRPYPISTPAFANVPFFGKFLGATVGSLIKPPKLMHCFSENSLVRTIDGLRPISDIKINDYVLTHLNRYKRVINIHVNNNNNEEAVKIYTTNTSYGLEITKGHNVLSVKMPICTRKGANKKHLANSKSVCHCKDIDLLPTWRQVGDLEIGDYLLQKVDYPIVSNIDLIKYVDSEKYSIENRKITQKGYGPKNKYTLNNISNFDLGWLFGIYAAEGHASKNGVCFSLHMKEIDYANKIKTILINLIPELNITFYERKETNCRVVNCSSTLLSDLFNSFHGIRKSLEIRPSTVSVEFIRGYILGAFDGDGCYIGKGANYSFTNVRYNIIKTVYNFFTSLNFVPKIYENNNKNKQKCFYLEILKNEFDFIFSKNQVESISYLRTTDSFVMDSYVYSRISSIEDFQFNKAFDLTVEEDHTYLVDDFIVHNSEEWMKGDSENQQYLNVPRNMDSNPYVKLGGTGIGKPVNPYSFLEVYGDVQYRVREASGLIGFIKNQIQKTFTGEETTSTGGKLLAESGAMYDTAKSFWNLELGGFATLTEIPRRFLPKERISSRNRYNPIKNDMPSWLPEEFKRGDPYTSVGSGYSRLPGAGYASLHPELKNVDPENYPLWYKYEILSNVSPYSKEYRNIKNRIYSLRKQGLLTKDQEEKVDIIDKQVANQKIKRNYYIESDEQRNQSPIKKFIRNTYFGMIDTIKDVAAPFEYLVFGGFRPTQKFLPVSNVVKDYERYAIYGSETSFWDFSRAWKDYFGPSLHSALKLVGYDGVPADLQRRRDIDQYFDRLNYYKFIKLSSEAAENGDKESSNYYKNLAHKTVYGVNPFEHPLSIYSALPMAEKDRYEGFIKLYKDADRKKVIELLPDDQKILFSTIWAKQDGVKIPKELRESYSDANKIKAVKGYLGERGIPREDWLGWNEHVDINDIKIKYIEDQGYEIFDFGIYPSQKELLAQKPYLNNLEDEIPFQPAGTLSSLLTSINNNFKADVIQNVVLTNQAGFSSSSYVSYIMDDRLEDITREYRRWHEN